MTDYGRLLTRFIQDNQEWSENTVEQYSVRLRNFFSYLSQKRIDSPDDIEPSTIADYFNFLTAEGYSWSTRNVAFTALNQFCEWLHQRQHLTNNPFSLAKKSKLLKRPRKRKKKVRRSARKEHLQAIIKSAESEATAGDTETIRQRGHRDLALIKLLINTGIRREEAASLTTEDINFDTGSILINGKAGKERYVFASEYALQPILDWLAIRPKTDNDSIFITLHTSFYEKHQPMSGRSVWACLKLRAKKVGLSSAAVSPHSIRHYYASMALRTVGKPGIDIYSLSKLLGHAAISTTELYLNMEPDYLRQAAVETAPEL